MVADRWDPALYRRFEDQRTRPARDLLAAVPLARARTAVDLGCGPGNSTELLVQRFPDAAITGLDSSDAMLASARERLPGVAFVAGDIAAWSPGEAPDLIYANAALHWVPDHEQLVPRLLGSLAPGGVLAVQVPDNRDEPSHRLMREVAAAGPWAARLDGASDAMRVLPAGMYYDMLVGAGAAVEMWRTVYHHPLDGPGAIVDWVRSTGLQPFLKRLAAEEQAAFCAQYQAALDAAYPAQRDGKRLLRFPRLFLIATAPA